MYKVMFDDTTGEYETESFANFKDALQWVRQKAIRTVNHIHVYYVRKNTTSPDGEWVINPWGKLEYNPM